MGKFVIGIPKGNNYIIGYKIVEKLLHQTNTVFLIYSEEAEESFEKEMKMSFKRAFELFNVLPGNLISIPTSGDMTPLNAMAESIDGVIISCLDQNINDFHTLNLGDSLIPCCIQSNKKVALVLNKSNLNISDLKQLDHLAYENTLLFLWSLGYVDIEASNESSLNKFIEQILDEYDYHPPISKEWDPSCE